MEKRMIKVILMAFFLSLFVNISYAQKKKATSRTAKKRTNTTTRKTAKGQTKTSISPVVVDSTSIAAAKVVTAPAVKIDSLPVPKVKKSLKPDEAVDTRDIRDRNPLAYEHLRVDDAVYRHKIWREIDAREKINLPFRYAADENNGNQRFISILMKAIQDSLVTAFSNIDDRFTTPLSISEVAKQITGGTVSSPIYDSLGQVTGYKEVTNEVNLDSFYKFQIKEEVIFDKEASRLFWRIIGIAPMRSLIKSDGSIIGDGKAVPLFWVYYPDMRPIFAKYEIYNGKNFGQRQSWEELFESRMFNGRIVKSTIDNPFDMPISRIPGLTDNGIFQLLEGERIKEKIFNYELDLWSY
jgi:gliding motility associated protien GldN